MKRFRSLTNSSQIVLRYEKAMPWLSNWRIEMIGDDETGITPEEIEAVLAHCWSHKLALVELAFDFAPETGVDRTFLLRHGLFGKSRRRKNRGGGEQLRYGGRRCPKLVRCYWKKELGRYRVELEVHSALLRKYAACKVADFGGFCLKLLVSHFQFVGIRWQKLSGYLQKKIGDRTVQLLLHEVQERASISLRRALRFLSRNGVTNPHRFLRPLKINRDIRAALISWLERFPLAEEAAPWK